MPRQRRLWALVAATALTIAGCSDTAEPGRTADINVVATTTILGDVARNIVGDLATVEVLIPAGADPHDYQASSQQAALLQTADLVVANGLGLEEGLVDVIEAAASDGANVFSVGPMLDPLPLQSEATSGEYKDDPHVWLDPLRVADAALLIAEELATVEPSIDWASMAEAYYTELRETDATVIEILSNIAPENRKLVTSHDSLRYFAQRYGFDVLGVVIPGGSTLADPSSAQLATLVDVIERAAVRAIFTETTETGNLAAAIAAEVGDIAVVTLNVGSLGTAGSEPDSLVDLLLANATLVAGALDPDA